MACRGRVRCKIAGLPVDARVLESRASSAHLMLVYARWQQSAAPSNKDLQKESRKDALMATLIHPAREANRADENRIIINPPDQFTNEPMIDWTNPENLRRMQAAIDKVRAELGQEYDLVIGGRRVQTGDIAPSLNPAKPSEVVGRHHQAGPAEVEPALQAALKAFESWSRTSLEERTQLLFRVG